MAWPTGQTRTDVRRKQLLARAHWLAHERSLDPRPIDVGTFAAFAREVIDVLNPLPPCPRCGAAVDERGECTSAPSRHDPQAIRAALEDTTP